MTIEDIALQMTPGIGIKGAVHLLELFGDARSIFAATADELVTKAGLRPSPPPTRNTRRCCAKSPIIPT